MVSFASMNFNAPRRGGGERRYSMPRYLLHLPTKFMAHDSWSLGSCNVTDSSLIHVTNQQSLCLSLLFHYISILWFYMYPRSNMSTVWIF